MFKDANNRNDSPPLLLVDDATSETKNDFNMSKAQLSTENSVMHKPRTGHLA